MEVKNGNVTATTTAAGIILPGDRPVRLILRNAGTTTVYLGDEDVTAVNGFPLLADEAYEWPVRVTSGQVYHVTASGTSDLRWLAAI